MTTLRLLCRNFRINAEFARLSRVYCARMFLPRENVQHYLGLCSITVKQLETGEPEEEEKLNTLYIRLELIALVIRTHTWVRVSGIRSNYTKHNIEILAHLRARKFRAHIRYSVYARILLTLMLSRKNYLININ